MKYDYGWWVLVAFHVVLFVSFGFSYLRPKNMREWRSMGVYSAFIVALYTEMYGFPLTIYLLGGLLGQYPFANPFAHDSGNLWASLLFGGYGATFFMGVGGVVIVLGVILLAKGWRGIHKSGGRLVTDGIYGTIRHPQYAALGLVIIGSLIQWPTLLTLVMAPILFFSYYRLVRREEIELEAQFGDAYYAYGRLVPAFFPGRRGSFLEMPIVMEHRSDPDINVKSQEVLFQERRHRS